MTRLEIYQQIVQKKSFLCVGLDTDIKKIPSFLLKEEDPVFEFNRRIIDATKDLCVAYKPNIAFYEAQGLKAGSHYKKHWIIFQMIFFTIADAKRGDIGNTSKLYSRAFFEKLHFDSVTVAPYMGSDSVTPFLHDNKTVIV